MPTKTLKQYIDAAYKAHAKEQLVNSKETLMDYSAAHTVAEKRYDDLKTEINEARYQAGTIGFMIGLVFATIVTLL